MYTPENIAKRNGLFDDPDIVKELDKVSVVPYLSWLHCTSFPQMAA